MGFLDKLLDVVGTMRDSYQVSRVYPTLQDALHKYLNAEEYSLMECTPFSAKLEKQGAFSTKTITLTVQDDGSVYIIESGFLGEETVFPKTAGTPTPQQFMQMLQEKEGQAHASQELDEERKMYIVFRTLFLMFGKLSKADSRVSEDEINSIEELMTSWEWDQEVREGYIEFFNEGKTTKTPFREIAAECAQHAEDVEMRRDALYCLVRIAAADGALHVREERYLNEAVAAFGLPPNVLAEALEEMLPDMQQYYAILGCDPSASDDELKRCYREVSRQYHPDVISSKNLAPGFEKFAKEKFQEIQNAYDIIIEHRKL